MRWWPSIAAVIRIRLKSALKPSSVPVSLDRSLAPPGPDPPVLKVKTPQPYVFVSVNVYIYIFNEVLYLQPHNPKLGSPSHVHFVMLCLSCVICTVLDVRQGMQ